MHMRKLRNQNTVAFPARPIRVIMSIDNITNRVSLKKYKELSSLNLFIFVKSVPQARGVGCMLRNSTLAPLQTQIRFQHLPHALGFQGPPCYVGGTAPV